jgi:hypothetical protein
MRFRAIRINLLKGSSHLNVDELIMSFTTKKLEDVMN